MAARSVNVCIAHALALSPPLAAVKRFETADGGHVKLRVLAWEDGVYTLDWAYAGAGRDSFGGE